ncbi:hypothetical protein [Maribacter sp. 2-571]|uniref:hypothetical protein n=1 Tax=Maribacter sp. 2-571 TaxID=3417569 RepID=UPI003D338603
MPFPSPAAFERYKGAAIAKRRGRRSCNGKPRIATDAPQGSLVPIPLKLLFPKDPQ